MLLPCCCKHRLASVLCNVHVCTCVLCRAQQWQWLRPCRMLSCATAILACVAWLLVTIIVNLLPQPVCGVGNDASPIKCFQGTTSAAAEQKEGAQWPVELHHASICAQHCQLNDFASL
jgi:hypothetical protein